MSTILIKNISVNSLTRDIFINDNIIESVSEKCNNHAEIVIDGTGCAAIPGLINMHTHAAMTMMRGIGEDMSLHDWLSNKIWPTEKRLTDEMIYWGTKLAALEMIKSGTTCYNDQYWRVPVAVKAAEEMGIRSVQSYVILDLYDKTKRESLKSECQEIYEMSKNWSRLSTFSISVHSIYSVSEEMILWASDFAKRNGIILHIHLSETERENVESIKKHGISPTKYLNKLGVLGPHVIAAHTLWVDEDDISILADNKVKIVHNINSNLKIASGYMFKYKEMKEAGLTISLGTDGCASSNNLDMIETMKTTSMIQKAWRGDPTILPLKELFELTTINAADSLGLNAGVIKEGALADLSIINLNSVAFTPNINFMANLIYSANGSCIDSVICDGKVLMKNRVVEGENEIIENVNRIYKSLL